MRVVIGTLAVGAMAVSQTASAQSLQDFDNYGRSDTRAVAGITIPLGGGGRSSQNTPRFDFNVQSNRIGQNSSFDHDVRTPAVIRWQAQRKSMLSLTLEQSPRLLMNGERVATFGPTLTADEQADGDGGGLGTGTVVLIGLGALTALTIAVVADADDAFDDLIDPD